MLVHWIAPFYSLNLTQNSNFRHKNYLYEIDLFCFDFSLFLLSYLLASLPPALADFELGILVSGETADCTYGSLISKYQTANPKC